MLKAANSSSLTTSPTPHDKIDEDGDKRLRRIARAGRQWKHTIGRKVDMEGMFCFADFSPNFSYINAVYVYRLCLEYARLWADDRDAMTYTA